MSDFRPKTKTINLMLLDGGIFVELTYKGSLVLVAVNKEDAHLVYKGHVIKQKNNKLRVDIVFNGKRWYLHRVILGLFNPKLIVDHIDGNPLNNQRSNLRVVTNQQNCYNRDKSTHNTTGYKGIWKRTDGRNKCWTAEIKVEKKKIHIGNFYTKEEAAEAYNKKAIELHKEFASINIIIKKGESNLCLTSDQKLRP